MKWDTIHQTKPTFPLDVHFETEFHFSKSLGITGSHSNKTIQVFPVIFYKSNSIKELWTIF